MIKHPENVDYLAENNYGLSIEWVVPGVGYIRAGRNFEWGKAFEITALVVIDGDIAEIKGMLGTYNKNVRKVLTSLLSDMGLTRIKYERKNTGRTRDKEIEL